MIILTDSEKSQILSGKGDQEWKRRCIEDPVEEVTAQYWFSMATKKWPNQIFIYFVCSGSAAWVRKKTVRMRHLINRPGTREECIDNHLSPRMMCMIYKEWDPLIKDEAAELGENPFVERLKELAKKHPL